MTESGEKKKQQVVYRLVRAARCYNCDAKLEPAALAKLLHGDEEKELYCISCAGLGALEFLPSKNARLTNLAKKYSTQSFVVMQWSALWKTYERQGLLVEPDAIE